MEIKNIIAKNITQLRQAAGMTQSELAEKVNYSDKAVSKWERGESMPDIVVLKGVADLFGVGLDYLVEETHAPAAQEQAMNLPALKRKNHMLITSMSVGLVWLVATAVFVTLVSIPKVGRMSWLAFAYALPIASIVWLVFNSVWFSSRKNYPIISLLMWSLIFALYLNLKLCGIGMWQLFLIGIPGQIIIVLWSLLRYKAIQSKS